MKIRKLFLCFVALAAVLGLAACDDDAASVKGITITSKDNKQEIVVDETLQLTATVFPENATEKGVLWSVSNDKIASVSDSGLVKGLAKGNVEVVATSKENKDISQKLALIVKEKPAEVIQPTSVKIKVTNDATEVAVGQSLRLETVVSPKGASQEVVWSSSSDALATVTTRGEVTGVKEGDVTITATCKDASTVKASVNLKVVQGTSTPSGDYESMPITSHADFMEAENDTLVKVKGVVTYVCPEVEAKVSYYIQNGADGYYVYEQNAVAYPVEVGKCYEVGGAKKYHQGNNEIVNVAYLKESNEKLTYTVNDLKGKDLSSLDDMKPYHNSYISAEAIITKTPVPTEKAYSVNVTADGKATTLRVDPKCLSPEEFTTIGNLFKNALPNVKIEFKGIMTAFGYGKASTQVQILKSTDIKIEEPSSEDLVAAAKGALTVKTSLGTGVTKLEIPSKVSGFDNVTISWASDNAAVIDAVTGTVVHPEADTIVTLTATLTHKTDTTVSDTKVFKVNVFGTVFAHEKLVTLDCEDAVTEGGQYGTSGTKPSYDDKKGNIVELGTPKYSWLLRNTLIAKDAKTEGNFGLRMQNNATAANAGRVEIQTSGEYNFVQFVAAIYGNDDPIVIGVEYLMDGTETWVDSGAAITLGAEKELYRVSLPEGSKRIAIYIIGTNGKRVNLDNIELYK